MQGFYLVLLAADWVYLATSIARGTGGLLHHPFTLTQKWGLTSKVLLHRNETFAGLTPILGGLLSVALALGLPQPSVRWNPALLQPGLSSCPYLMLYQFKKKFWFSKVPTSNF